MENNKLETKIAALLEPIIEDMGFELVEIKTLSNQGRYTLRLTADCEGGITLDECVRISREIAPHLEVADLIAPRYSLEVSSPGIRRPLRKAADYTRFAGQPVSIRLHAALEDSIEGRKRFRGINHGLDDEGKLILESEEGPDRMHIRLDEIKESQLDPEIKIGSGRDRADKKANKQ
jgi:ribosome maturation factor RimP